ncbi:bifunctional diguanylate cyclase/phosphodiesterase [Clostridium gasigenes]|uniref:putative bifunctional diguanylate cyclase/phosphodiesterase n=1 Tax=Clostridium gasigenes TaxID=94869 RepID=UPI001C0BF245|nr:bifunctional diguanylate cyclase/phosphodiesterase [Clostridium gasigenes]MBU3136663.1 bifunctional diguanylate cyclase/phosphodiesterase [Clostridium gasigenes]
MKNSSKGRYIIKLMRKIALIFITVTIISSVLYYALGKKIINVASSGELDRGPGRTNAVIKQIEGEINKITSQAREFGENFEITDKIDNEYGVEERKRIINIEKKIEKASITNMLIVNNNFEVNDIIKGTNLDINNIDTQDILNQAKDIMNKKENKGKGFFGGVITTKELSNIVGVKRINTENSKDNTYTVIINPINEVFMENINEITGRNIEIIKDNESIKNDKKIKKVNLYGRDFYCKLNEESIDIFTKFESLGNGPEYYIKLRDDRQVRNNATKNISTLIGIIMILNIICNVLLYIFIKIKVLARIININNVVNKVTKGTDLEIELQNDIYNDEISVLTGDLNKMFGRLKKYANNLEYIGSHDLLTSLINRNKLTEYISELKNNNEEFALFFIDLDNFKNINDTLGHNVGDELLCQVAKELKEYTENENIIISRIGGDEFIVVRKGKNNNDEIERFANSMLIKLNKIYSINNYSYEIKASMGISLYPQHSADEVSLMQYSDIAMYHSKKNGGNKYNIFNKKMLESLEIENKLKNAIRNEEFEVYYQPIYCISNNKIIGAEALVRWKTEDGMIYPDKFIPLAKKTGDIVDIDMFVLRQAISLCREWIDKGKEQFYVSINASKRFLKQNNFIEIIEKELKYQNVPTSALKLEITEDEIIDDAEYTEKLLKEIRKIGIGVYLDDFGTGYSSFNHIKTLPIDVVKIDRSLLINIEQDIEAKSIVETMISLCHKLKLKVVCEGVEELAQVEILKQINCDDIQGYYFSKPLPKQLFNKFLEEF